MLFFPLFYWGSRILNAVSIAVFDVFDVFAVFAVFIEKKYCLLKYYLYICFTATLKKKLL